MARKSGIRYDISNPQTRPDDVFNEHTLALQFKQASLRQLIAFDEALAKETPYIGLASLKLIPEKQNPYTLSAQWNLFALELSNLTEIGNMQSN